MDELLSVPTLASETGYNESMIVHILLELWKHLDMVQVGLLDGLHHLETFRVSTEYAFCWKTRYIRSMTPVAGLLSSSDGIDFSQNIHVVW